ncbi:MarR family winged helix-turn-helix transcriptional regulator [Cognatazoarcus halotolerans]|uniref:MarR family winged helix-turn-helix transcriptional regulator n=1 Tax=Cognatazoarcus halotolerans TaxID=2686016 RepID=UPI001357C03B|nr:MarR family winged helix-turn-helix transcriptional regulator [Cognatazoarcus halotolerans]MBX3679686.1 winged helix-turn-helix transcriptional regulator [Rhodocyclaceae bacterium]MCB1901540.1 winged helix-turn-helix transcriptional regulator [Rhodocyclaceae bacterium]MCP5307942.1 winged helix-turn-helix transcriptional regulator [Zoogloeaceae bacterium]
MSVEPLPCTGARLRRLTRRMTVFYEQYLRSVGLRLTQYSVLAHLSEVPQSLLELAARLETDRTTLSRGLRPLIANGWVSEMRGADARQHLFVLSAEGFAFRALADAHWREAQLALEDVLDREFVEDFHESLERALIRLKPALPEEN